MRCTYVRTHQNNNQIQPAILYIFCEVLKLGRHISVSSISKGMQVLSVSLSFFFFLFLISSPRETRADETKNNRVYIVYMGAATSSDGSYRYDHAQILNSVLKRLLITSYTNKIKYLNVYTIPISNDILYNLNDGLMD